MKTYLASIIPKVQQFSQKLENEALLTSKHWVVIDDTGQPNYKYIFRSNSDLLVSHNGKVQKGRWDYIGNDSIYIEIGEERSLFKHGFFNEDVLALKADTKNEYAFLINDQSFHQKQLKSIGAVKSLLMLKSQHQDEEEEYEDSVRAYEVDRAKKAGREKSREVTIFIIVVVFWILFFSLLVEMF